MNEKRHVVGPKILGYRLLRVVVLYLFFHMLDQKRSIYNRQ